MNKVIINSIIVGIPNIIAYENDGDYNIMIMELLGQNLEELFNCCNRRFTIKTVLMIADQMVFLV